MDRATSPWPVVRTEHGGDYGIFRVREEEVVHPVSGQHFERVVLETPDWANVIAVRDDGRIVMVRQYRFGRREQHLEIPGGMVDPGESAERAARRELLEETGYGGGRWSRLGRMAANPAFLDNEVFVFLAEGVRPVRDARPDEGEDIAFLLLSADEVRRAVLDGTIRHSIMVAALSMLLDVRSACTVGSPDSDQHPRTL